LEADYVVLGGGNARKLKKLPKGARLGNNDFAFLGGFRMWRADGTTGSLDGGRVSTGHVVARRQEPPGV
jgi:hypothetical protein